MAITVIEGSLSIDLVDVYQWLESRGINTEGAKNLEFVRAQDSLVLSFVDGRTVEVEAAEFWAWVIDKQLPRGFAEFETVFGVPVRGDDGYFQVTFAASNYSDPRTWASPPACLAEWDSKE